MGVANYNWWLFEYETIMDDGGSVAAGGVDWGGMNTHYLLYLSRNTSMHINGWITLKVNTKLHKTQKSVYIT